MPELKLDERAIAMAGRNGSNITEGESGWVAVTDEKTGKTTYAKNTAQAGSTVQEEAEEKKDCGEMSMLPQVENITVTQPISILCKTLGVSIYYTTDGSEPIKGAEGTTKFKAGGFTCPESVKATSGSFTVRATAIDEKKGLKSPSFIQQTFTVQEPCSPAIVVPTETHTYKCTSPSAEIVPPGMWA